MTVVNTFVKPFKAHAFYDEKFVEITEKDLEGKWSIFVFYPADFSFVCPTELGDIADHYEEFKSLGVEIYSISCDTHFAHKAWHDISDTIKKVKFPMIADPAGILARNFGVLVEDEGLAMRATFVINPNLKILICETYHLAIGRSATELLRRVKAAQHIANNPKEVCLADWHPGECAFEPSVELVGKI